MSVYVQSMVFEADLKTATRKVLMLCLADKANKDGTGAYPSQRTIAKETHLDRKTIRTALAELVEEGILQEVGKKKALKGVMEYNISLPKLRQLQDIEPLGENSPGKKSLGENSPLLGENSPSTGGITDPKPSINHQETARTRASREAGSRLSELFAHRYPPTSNHRMCAVVETLCEEVAAFDGRRVLIKSRFMADRLSEALSADMRQLNLIITTNAADMQIEEVDA